MDLTCYGILEVLTGLIWGLERGFKARKYLLSGHICLKVKELASSDAEEATHIRISGQLRTMGVMELDGHAVEDPNRKFVVWVNKRAKLK
ncbi:MAG: hypothetical protein HY882_12330 [Deltaproteobacteria bacterium]|nr:hypothetical protein [Deltaproteobacteria bacterium]